ncbi:hypothetical protein HID58_048175 [Brassica napus]|uniref:Uncharacterized protein n=1 Tax=Brassica napus TaxID=3708 RepID=A0ABQ8B1C6_BRANA|nr:hypothetical protein HID58_048175 [Brassica napus]
MAKSNGKEPTTLIFNDFTLGLGEADLFSVSTLLGSTKHIQRGVLLYHLFAVTVSPLVSHTIPLQDNQVHLKEEMGLGYLAQKIISVDPYLQHPGIIFGYRLQLCRMRGFIDWVFHLPNLMASSSILLLGSDPFSRENEEQNNQCVRLGIATVVLRSRSCS